VARANGLEAEHQRLNAVCARLTADADDLSRRLDEVFASRSWQLTAPLRALGKRLGRQ